MVNPKNLIRFVPAEGLDVHTAPIPVFRTKEARAMRKHRFFPAAALAAILPFTVSPALSADRSLTVYTYESFIAEWGPGPKIEAAFEAECGCDLKWVGIADGVALLNRLRLEGENAEAGVVLGLDTNLVAEAKTTGLFEAHGLDTSAVSVPGDFSDDVFIPYDYGHFAVVYDSEAISTPPSSLKELVEGDPEQKIVIQDPRTSTPGLGLLLWMKSVYGDDAAAAWEKLSGRVLTVTPGWSEGLWPVHLGRSADGAVLHHLARLPHGRRGHRPLSGGGIHRRPLPADRGRRTACQTRPRRIWRVSS
jgi:ABC-type thiamine transport system substrate-binding protein